MTIPSIKFQCPKCGNIELHITDGPQYCSCNGKGQTKRSWLNNNGVKRVRKIKSETKFCC